MQNKHAEWPEHHIAVGHDGTINADMSSTVPAGLLDTHTKPYTVYNFGKPNEIDAFALLLGQQGVFLSSRIIDNNSRKVLGTIGNLLIASKHVSLQKLESPGDFEALNKGDLIYASDGTDAPPRHHTKRFRAWENRNFAGYVYGFETSMGQAILIDKSGGGMFVNRFRINQLTFSKVLINRP